MFQITLGHLNCLLILLITHAIYNVVKFVDYARDDDESWFWWHIICFIVHGIFIISLLYGVILGSI